MVRQPRRRSPRAGSAAGSCAGDALFQETQHRLLVPRGDPGEPRDLAPLSVDEQRGGQARGFESGCAAARGVDVKRQMPDAFTLKEGSRRVGPGPIEAQGDHLEARAAEPRLQAVERGHFHLARRAPGRPQVQKHEAPAPVGEAALPSAAVLKHHVGHLARRRVHDKFFQLLAAD